MRRDVAIRVENLGKRYRIGQQRESYKSLRESLVHAAAAPFRRLRGEQAPKNDTFWALKDVSFEVKHGEVVGVIGRNGAGKSTLLKLLTRITDPTAGRVELNGRVASLLEVGTGFHPELTGRENIYMNGAILGMTKREIASKFDEIVAFAEVEKFLDTPVKRYSSGMYVRLAFAVAAHLEPEILLVDEVLAVGDAQFQQKCLGKMGEVAKGGRTVLFVSHNMAAVEQLCHCGLLIDQGQVKGIGSSRDIITRYLAYQHYSQSENTSLFSNTKGDTICESLIILDRNSHQRLAVVQCGQSIMFLLHFILLNIKRTITVALGINDIYGTRLITLRSDISGYELRPTNNECYVKCFLDNFPLFPGIYSIDIKLLAGHEVLLWGSKISKLVVETGDFYHTGRLPDQSWSGMFHITQEWSIDANAEHH